MPPRHRRRAVTFRHRPRTWSDFDQTVAVAHGGNSNQDLIGDLTASNLVSTAGATMMASFITIQVTNFAATTDKLSWGVIVGRSDDIGTSTTGLTAAKFELPWAWQETFFPTSSAATVDASEVYFRPLKSRRVLRDANTRLLIIFTNQSPVTDLTMHVRARTLLALA
jgi:hypothetical protein